MFNLRVLTVAAGVIAVTASLSQAQDTDVKAIVRKAIDAHGGTKNLDKYKAFNTKFKGTMTIMGVKVNVDGDTTLQKPDKVKNVLILDINGKSIDVTNVFNGKKLWVKTMGQTKEIDDEKILKAAREEMESEGAGSLLDFLKAPYELNTIGEVKVKDKDAIGVRISKKGQKDITMFFDKKTHLVVKTETQAYDPSNGQEVLQEKFIHSYQKKHGMEVARRVEIVKDGKTFMDIEITEVTPLETVDASIFAKP
ncbi:MAG: hypothetical protein FJ303_16975 [Planctomycetes bacterium]|nr:hypothetical protein [Planctomycetota bacterium]